jgi:hypothetical protein
MRELIEVDLDKIPPEVSAFVQLELDKCRRLGVPIHMPRTRTVLNNGFDCAGYFDDTPLAFAVACGKSYRTWFPTFVHESCHLDQWADDRNVWDQSVHGAVPLTVFDDWLQHKVELDDDTKCAVASVLLNVELDCERRSVAKIKQYDLPINIDTYTRKGNAYVWSYRLMQETRNWDHSAAYEYPQVWRKMPKHFNTDYSVLPDAIRAVFEPVLDQLKRAD